MEKLEGLKFLVVEDDPTVRLLVKKLLKIMEGILLRQTLLKPVKRKL